MYGNQLATTGMATVTVGGVMLGGWWLLAVSVLLVLVGTALVRVGFRAGKGVADA